jgi:hypothetical protein
VHFQHHDGDDDGDHAITERGETIFAHRFIVGVGSRPLRQLHAWRCPVTAPQCAI